MWRVWLDAICAPHVGRAAAARQPARYAAAVCSATSRQTSCVSPLLATPNCAAHLWGPLLLLLLPWAGRAREQGSSRRLLCTYSIYIYIYSKHSSLSSGNLASAVAHGARAPACRHRAGTGSLSRRTPSFGLAHGTATCAQRQAGRQSGAGRKAPRRWAVVRSMHFQRARLRGTRHAIARVHAYTRKRVHVSALLGALPLCQEAAGLRIAAC